MSGGVDSTLVAALLLEQGFEVEGVTLDLLPTWACAPSSGASSLDTDPAHQAAAVCAQLGIKHHVLDARLAFTHDVMAPFAQTYAQGRTPNPCVLCNPAIKFGLMLEWALAHGFDTLATGHYARLLNYEGITLLARARDHAKDQSYFLYRVPSTALAHALFPLAELTKPEVRAAVRARGLNTAEQPESQDVCFLNYCTREYVIARLGGVTSHEGTIVDESGKVLGTHTGIERFTVGQRKGLGIGGFAEPRYVTALDAQTQTVTVGTRQQAEVTQVEVAHLVGPAFIVEERGSTPLAGLSLDYNREQVVDVRLRYRMEPLKARALRLPTGRLALRLEEPVVGVAPGQSAVLSMAFEGDEIILGGGFIECAV